jgi:hypothetical protein
MAIWDSLAMRPEVPRHARVAADDVRPGNQKHTLRIRLCNVFANSWGAHKQISLLICARRPLRSTFLIPSCARCRAGWWTRASILSGAGQLWGYRRLLCHPSINPQSNGPRRLYTIGISVPRAWNLNILFCRFLLSLSRR